MLSPVAAKERRVIDAFVAILLVHLTWVPYLLAGSDWQRFGLTPLLGPFFFAPWLMPWMLAARVPAMYASFAIGLIAFVACLLFVAGGLRRILLLFAAYLVWVLPAVTFFLPRLFPAA